MKTKWQWLTVCLVFTLAVGALAACSRNRGVEAAKEGEPPSVSPAEQDFMMKAEQAHLGEIEMARLALQKSDNNDVRDYAGMIQKHHNGALKDLADLMQKKNVPQAKALAADSKQGMDELNKLLGPEFDREFMNIMVSDHEKAVGMFRDQQATVQNPDVKDYVEDLLPQLQKHLDKAHELQSRLFGAPAPKPRT
jgi:putative membrane protein